MKNIILLLFIALMIGRFVSEGQDVSADNQFLSKASLFSCTEGHFTYIDTTGAEKARQKLKQARNSRSSNCEFDRSKMKHWILLAYDEVLLEKYTKAEVEGILEERALNRMVNTHICADIKFHQLVPVYLPVEVPVDYTSIFDIVNMFTSAPFPDRELAWINYLRQDYDYHFVTFFTKEMNPTTAGRGAASMVTEEFPNVDITNSVVNYTVMLTLGVGANTAVHEHGHNIGCDHEVPFNGSISLPDARAYAGTFARSPVTNGTILGLERDCWSGPNSIVSDYNGDTIALYDGIGHNARSAQIGMDIFRDVVDRTEIQLDYNYCGNGSINVCTNNANEWDWKLVSGNVQFLSSPDSSFMNYISYEQSVLQVIGKNGDKPYGDTVEIILPAIESITIDTALFSGDQLPDGTQVDGSGLYETIEVGGASNGCDLLVTYNVQITSSIDESNLGQLGLFPNPASNMLNVRFRDFVEKYQIRTITGRTVLTGELNTSLDVSSLSTGLYLITVSINGSRLVDKFLKI